MVFKKKFLILSIILVGLAVLYTFGIVFSPSNIQRREIEKSFFQTIQSAKIHKIEMEKSDNTMITLVKNQDGSWAVEIEGTFYPADTNKITNFIERIAEMKYFREITNDVKNWENFEVSENKAGKLLMSDSEGRNVLTLYVGKEGIGGEGNYIRIEEENTVYLSEISVGYYIDQETNYWSQLKILPADLQGDDITSISVDASIQIDEETGTVDTSYILVKEVTEENENIWTIENDDVEINQTKAVSLANAITKLRGAEFCPPSELSSADTGLQDPKAVVNITTGTGKTYTISVGNQRDENQFYLKMIDSPMVYAVSKWNIRNILKSKEELTEITD
jgi:hypothetical protein